MAWDIFPTVFTFAFSGNSYGKGRALGHIKPPPNQEMGRPNFLPKASLFLPKSFITEGKYGDNEFLF